MCLRSYFTQEEERTEIFYHLYPTTSGNSESQIVCLL